MSTRTCRLVPASPAPYWAQDGWIEDAAGNRIGPRWVKIAHNFTSGCKYDKQHEDQECAGCVRRNKGEAE